MIFNHADDLDDPLSSKIAMKMKKVAKCEEKRMFYGWKTIVRIDCSFCLVQEMTEGDSMQRKEFQVWHRQTTRESVILWAVASFCSIDHSKYLEVQGKEKSEDMQRIAWHTSYSHFELSSFQEYIYTRPTGTYILSMQLFPLFVFFGNNCILIFWKWTSIK